MKLKRMRWMRHVTRMKEMREREREISLGKSEGKI
jgi:hypothetical protein